MKDKIKRVNRLLRNSALYNDIPRIFNQIASMMTKNMTCCAIAVDRSGYPSQAFLDALASAIAPQTKVTLITGAGCHNEWFRHIKVLGWDFIGRIRVRRLKLGSILAQLTSTYRNMVLVY
ncbi:hypothetical protein KP22_19920 [Pectobacterium betavasculorum]|uniref:Transposase n=1 Tax=Pectobacterium betavasculorum TaxID=55207 RepID=A0A093RJ69_9GAMM|nr:hypothetical protein KP22_19920 [Pectobacterium betavasculorum]KFX14315.1 hypothetical protein JV35_19235 [Pectobacterium betavasculorum]